MLHKGWVIEDKQQLELAPVEGALRQGLPAVEREGRQLHSCLHLRWTKGFPPPKLQMYGRK